MLSQQGPRISACLFCLPDAASQPGQDRRKIDPAVTSPDPDRNRRGKTADFRQAFMLEIVHDNRLRLNVHDPVFPDARLCILGMLGDQIPASGTRGQDLDDQIRRSLATL